MRLPWLLALCALVTACAADTSEDIDDETDDLEEAPAETAEALSKASSVSCTMQKMTGYQSGRAYKLDVITIGGKRTTRTTGHAFLKMQKGAKASGVNLVLSSGFRTNAEQQKLYGCYKKGSCNNGNLAAKPGYSNHQSGKALDIGGAGSASWLAKNGTRYGFRATVKGEPWHWEYSGKDPGGPCSGSAASSDDDDSDE